MNGRLSSEYFIPRDTDPASLVFKRVRMMPMYSFPPFKEFNFKIKEHDRRFFIHLDLDAFFAQAEQRDNPKYRGKPVGVVSVPDSRTKGIVMTASYEARALGIDIAMSTIEALRICPTMICAPCYGQKYEAILLNILDMIRTYVPDDCIEQYSIDECFIDITHAAKTFDQAILVAKEIKSKIKSLENLTSSIGLSYNKTYAKIATKMHKPDGFTVITHSDKERIYDLDIDKIWGIGSRIKFRLNIMNIFTIRDLANAYSPALRKEFGINGIVYNKMARGEDTCEIFHKINHEKSLMHQHSMDNEIYEPGAVLNELRRVGEYLCRKLRTKKLTTGSIALFLRYDTMEYSAYAGKLPQPTNDDRELFNTARTLFKKMDHPTKHKRARAFAMAAFDLQVDSESKNLELFDVSINFPYRSLDNIKSRFGENIIRVGLTSKN
ncbi:MAG: DNA polymerase IV [Ignavibacteria bacterium]